MQKITEEEILEVEKQLSCPSGLNGVEMGKKMNETNIGMTRNSIQLLDLKDENCVLELGHGNCGHLHLILEAANRLKYFGLEVSVTMWEEAEKKSSNTHAKFRLYNGQLIPYSNNHFDRILTVNTIYFWPEPEVLLSEIERTLKDDGVFVLTYGDKSFMKDLPYVKERFRLYDKDDIRGLVKSSNLKIIDFVDKTDEVKSKTGDMVRRNYTIVRMKRK